MIAPAEVDAVRGMARDFARRTVAPAAGEASEGVPDVLAAAERVGLLATNDAADPGHDLGVWGRAYEDLPPTPALIILEEIAIVSPGIALAVHGAGLAACEPAGCRTGARRPAVALLEDGALSCDLPAAVAGKFPSSRCTAVRSGEHTRISGTKSFVWAPPGTDGYVVFAQGPAGWEAGLVLLGQPGLVVESVGQRLGLMACPMVHLRLDAAVSAASTRRSPAGVLRRLWLGLAAIALGNARGALRQAAAYAGSRFQGGRLIAQLPAVQLLLGQAEARVEMAAAALAAEPAPSRLELATLRRAALLKVWTTRECCTATSNALQVFGGYGYMEDLPLAGRLRDALCLSAMAGRSDDLLRLVGATADPCGSDRPAPARPAAAS